MNALCFAAHNDDESLFCFYQLLRLKPEVIVVLRSYKQWLQQGGPDFQTREAETTAAMEVAGCAYTQWEMPDTDVAWNYVADSIRQVLKTREPEVVIYPAMEMGGHFDHNSVASIVGGIEGPWTHIRYLTYRQGYGRSDEGSKIDALPEERELKAQALNCYASQKRHAQTSAWFPPGPYGTLDEWIAGASS